MPQCSGEQGRERAQGSELPGGKDKGWACWLVGKGQMEEGGREEEKRMLAAAGSGGSGVRGCSSHTSGLTMGAEPKSTARGVQGAARVGRRCFPEETAGIIPRHIVGFFFPVG